MSPPRRLSQSLSVESYGREIAQNFHESAPITEYRWVFPSVQTKVMTRISKMYGRTIGLLQENGRPTALHNAVGHDGNPVPEKIRLFHEMRREEKRPSIALLLKQVPNHSPSSRIHPRGWFVQDYHSAPPTQRHADGKLPLHPSGQGLRLPTNVNLQIKH